MSGMPEVGILLVDQNAVVLACGCRGHVKFHLDGSVRRMVEDCGRACSTKLFKTLYPKL